MTEHTPGSWLRMGDIVAQDGTTIAIVSPRYDGDEWAANSMLIAAAPDLLWALENIIDESPEPPEANCSCHINPPCSDCVDYTRLREAYRYARAAIAKATGEKP